MSSLTAVSMLHFLWLQQLMCVPSNTHQCVCVMSELTNFLANKPEQQSHPQLLYSIYTVTISQWENVKSSIMLISDKNIR